MGIFDSWVCPNIKCDRKRSVGKGKQCPQCGALAQKLTASELVDLFRKKDKYRKAQEIDTSVSEKVETSETEPLGTPMGMLDSEYEACIDNLGLLEGEEVKLQYVCFRNVMSPPSAFRKLLVDNGAARMESKKGLLVFTNDSMLFMQQEGAWSENYAQALRIPLEQISGVVSGGTFIPHIRILVGIGGASEQHEFVTFQSVDKPIHEVRAGIERLLREARQEKKRLAQEALAKGTLPSMIFCRYCGARNKADHTRCKNCGAVLT